MTTEQASNITPILLVPEGKCPYALRRGDIDYCGINDKLCLLESGLQCEEWQEIQEEWAKEEEYYKIASESVASDKKLRMSQELVDYIGTNCILCGRDSKHICLQCCINYAVQAGASRHRIRGAAPQRASAVAQKGHARQGGDRLP